METKERVLLIDAQTTARMRRRNAESDAWERHWARLEKAAADLLALDGVKEETQTASEAAKEALRAVELAEAAAARAEEAEARIRSAAASVLATDAPKKPGLLSRLRGKKTPGDAP